MGEKMTLEQVRMQIAALGYNETRSRWLETIDAHLTQPAQAVDVNRAADRLGEYLGTKHAVYLAHSTLREAVQVALPPQPAQAVDVVAIRRFAKELSMDFVANEKQLRRWADKLTAALTNANGKEG